MPMLPPAPPSATLPRPASSNRFAASPCAGTMTTPGRRARNHVPNKHRSGITPQVVPAASVLYARRPPGFPGSRTPATRQNGPGTPPRVPRPNRLGGWAVQRPVFPPPARGDTWCHQSAGLVARLMPPGTDARWRRFSPDTQTRRTPARRLRSRCHQRARRCPSPRHSPAESSRSRSSCWCTTARTP